MTAHQTFEEWLYEKGYAKNETGYARSIWQAAMENAALVCEEGMDRNPKGEPYDSAFNAHAFSLAEAIREAAKR